MKSRAIVFREANVPRIEEVLLPSLAPDQVRVRIAYSGVSIGTEQSIFSGLRVHNGTFPVVTGYMASGTVEETGADVRKLREDDRVICMGAKFAEDSGINSVWGGHSSMQIVAAGACAPVPDAVDMKEAAVYVMPGVGLNAAHMAGIGLGDTVLIQGQGLIGQLCGQWCRNRGARVITIEPDPVRRELSRRLVTGDVIDPVSEDVSERVHALTDGHGPTVVVEATAAAKLIPEATRFLSPGGKMIFLSWYPGKIQLDFAHFHNNEVTTYFPMGAGGPDAKRITLNALAAGSLRMADNITDVYPFEIACDGYQRIVNGDRSIMAMVVDWGERMNALLTDNAGKLWMQEIAPPTPGDYECLVRMESCAFCHSTDRHIVNGTFLEKFTAPSILGHEAVGIIVTIGPKVMRLAPGDRVVRASARYPDQVENGIGSAWGGFAEFGKVTDWPAMVDDGVIPRDGVPHVLGYMQKIPADIPCEKAALLVTQKEIYSATAKIESVQGKRFLVAGAGITACFFGLFLKRRGAGHVTFVARRPAPLEFALSRGVADDVCIFAEVGRLSRMYDGLIETTGNMAATESLTDAALRDDGTIYSYAVYEGMLQQGFFDKLSARRRFVRVNPAEASAHDAVVELIRAGELDAEPFVTACFPFKEWEAAWSSVTGKTSLKTVIRFDV